MKDEIFEEIKRRVIGLLDLSKDTSDDELLCLIDEVLTGENKLEGITLNERIGLRKRLFDSIRRLDILQPLLEDDSVSEIMVNGPDKIFIERYGCLQKYDKAFSSLECLEEIIRKIVCRINRVVNESNPIVDARLEDGSRVNVVLPPVSVNGPVLTIRKFDKGTLPMPALIEKGTITQEMAEYLKEAVRAGKNIFISGGTSSGKTTFLNALSDYIPSNQRVVVIEDSSELSIRNINNLVRLEVRNANPDGERAVTIRDLIKTSLRMRPDRIIVGEVRDGACMDMLQAMLTGHDGSMSTGHGSSSEDMIFRLETMALMAEALPVSAIRGQIGSALDIMVHMVHFTNGERKVVSVSEVEGYDRRHGEVMLKCIYNYYEDNGDI